MAAMAARTVLKRIMTSGLVDILTKVPARVQKVPARVQKVPARVQKDDHSSSIQLREIRQVKLSKQKRSYGGGI
jgi:hypothetical protein